MADTTHTASTADLDALRVAPAAHLSEEMSRASAAGGDAVALRELPFTVQVGLRAQPGTASGAALEEAYGLPLPRSVGEVTGDGAGLHILWLSPDEFLAVDVSRRPRAFGVGSAIVTALGPVPVLLHHSAEHEYRIYPRASFADFTVRWLLDGMAEFLAVEAGAG